MVTFAILLVLCVRELGNAKKSPFVAQNVSYFDAINLVLLDTNIVIMSKKVKQLPLTLLNEFA